MRRPALALSLAAALAACGPGDGPATTAPTSGAAPPADLAAPPPPAGGAGRPATDTGVVTLEGTDEEVALRLVRYPDLPAPFSTYLPDGWTDGVSRDGDSPSVRFSTSGPSPATLSVSFVSSGVEAAIEAARATTVGTDDVRPLEGAEPWVRFGRSFVVGGAYGSVRVGEHEGAAFVVREAVPFERGDGFYPRAMLVLDRLRWLDTGAGL